MSRAVDGSCLCAAIRFELTPPTRFCAHCHCSNCRRAHGAAFVTWVGLLPERLRIVEGNDHLVRYPTDTGAVRSFCDRCGATLFYEGPRWEGEIHVTLASLHGPIDREPEAHAYVDHKADWWRIDDELPRYGGTSGAEPKSSSD